MNMQNGQPIPVQPTQPQQGQYAPAPTQNMQVAPGQPGYPQQSNQPPVWQPQPGQQSQPPAPPAAPTYPTFPTFATNPANNLPSQPAPPAPAPAAPQAGRFEDVYQAVATDLGMSVDQVRASFQDDPRRFGQIMKAAAKALQTPAPAPVVQPAPAPVQPQGEVQIPEQAFAYMKRNEQTRLWEPVSPDVAPYVSQYAHAQNVKEWQAQTKAKQYQEDPTAIMRDPKVAELIQKQIDQKVEQVTRTQQLEAVREQYREKYLPVILERNPQGQVVSDWEGKPVLTAIGASFDKWCKALYNDGMQESARLYETAMAMAERENPPVQQQPPQQFSPFGGLPQVPTGQYPQYPQQNQPMTHTLLRRNANANVYQPGGAPPRAPQPVNHRLPLRETLQVAMQGMPQNEGLEYYWKSLGMATRNG